ncbi:MAG: helix-turn-helix transcriptional regulator [bacterium]|nr:helix-turn-helix transcriptional regulator [Candidatus Colisoma equi]
MPVTNLSPEICQKLKDARRTAKLSQSVVAAEVGCKQSALSMFEQGDGTKLNDAVIRKLAEKFGVSLTATEASAGKPTGTGMTATSTRGFCPNPKCPSNRSYEVDARTFVRPDRSAADPVGGKFCAVCGEILEKCCPNCGAPVHDGAICSFCGEPYIAVV